MRKNEHPRCGCRSCRRGAGSPFGQLIHKAGNRKIRRATRQALRTLPADDLDTFVSVIVPAPLTD